MPTLPATVTLKGIWALVIALAFALLLGLLVVQTVRLEGFKFWPISIEGCLAKSERLQLDVNNVKVAQDRALEKMQAAKTKAEQKYRDFAEKTNEKLEQARADAMDATERHIAANRVRPETLGRASSRPAPAAGDRGAGIPEVVPSDTLVAVTDSDVRACTEWVAEGIAIREWAAELVSERE